MISTPLLLRPFAIRRVSLLWGGLTLSAVGAQFYAVALVWVAVSVFGPALLLICGAVPVMVAGCGLAEHWNDARGLGLIRSEPI